MIIGMCILVQFYNNNKYIAKQNNINKLKYINAPKKMRAVQHNVPRNAQYNEPHNVPDNAQYNEPHNVPHNAQYNVPHNAQYNVPHNAQYNVPHNIHFPYNNINEHHHVSHNIDPFENSMKEFDFRNVRDVFVPPIKRPSESVVMPVITNPQYNIYTRGYPGKYSWMGILINVTEPSDNASFSQDNKIIKLFGKQQYPGSTQYKYYVTINTGNDQTKINLDKEIYKRELYDDDIVVINELGMSFKVKMNDSNWLEYSPYVV